MKADQELEIKTGIPHVQLTQCRIWEIPVFFIRKYVADATVPLLTGKLTVDNVGIL